ncbi:MAG: NrdH-redoxin [Deltaproteobacteria bacterium]|nr:NrdH-redoxin [Deltaproteobacteria bacterium]
MNRLVFTALVFTLITCVSAAAEGAHPSGANPAKTTAAKNYPQIVLYSVVWCYQCREIKEYLTKNNIPFINRDVEADTKAMEDLTIRYNSTGVPVIVLGKGKDEVIMKGFTPELFQEKLKKATLK